MQKKNVHEFLHMFLHAFLLHVIGRLRIFVLFPGETDWKVIAIDTTDPLSTKLNGGCLICETLSSSGLIAV